MSPDDQPTEQIQRVPPAAPLPGTLNPAPVAAGESGSTEVLSLDELFDRPATAAPPAAAPAPAPAAPPPPAAPAAAAAAPAADRRIGAVPVTPASTGPGLTDRLRGDATAAWRGGLTRSRAWLGAGDNVLIVGTVLVALLLILVVAFV